MADLFTRAFAQAGVLTPEDEQQDDLFTRAFRQAGIVDSSQPAQPQTMQEFQAAGMMPQQAVVSQPAQMQEALAAEQRAKRIAMASELPFAQQAPAEPFGALQGMTLAEGGNTFQTSPRAVPAPLELTPAQQRLRATIAEVAAKEEAERAKRIAASAANPKAVAQADAMVGALSGTLPLGVAEHQYAAKVPPEHRDYFLERLRERYAADQSMKGQGFWVKLGTSAIQGAADFGLPAAKLLAGEPKQPTMIEGGWSFDASPKPPSEVLPELTADQERFKSEMLAIREQVDPTNVGGFGGAVQAATRMAVPQIIARGAGTTAKAATAAAGAGAAAQGLAMGAGVSGAFLPMTADSTYTQMVQEGIDPDTAKWVARLSSPIEAAIESVLPDPLAGYQGAFRGTLRQVAGKMVKQYGVNYLMELSEEELQAIVNETANEAARAIDKDVPNKGLGSIFVAASDAVKETALPLALMMAPGASVNAAANVRESAKRPGRLKALQDYRAQMEQFQQAVQQAAQQQNAPGAETPSPMTAEEVIALDQKDADKPKGQFVLSEGLDIGGEIVQPQDLQAKEQELYQGFYATPANAAIWAEENPEAAKRLATGSDTSAKRLASLGLPPMEGVGKQFQKAVQDHLNAPESIRSAFGRVLAEGQGDDLNIGKGWQRVPDGIEPPQSASIDVYTGPAGTFVRLKPRPLGPEQIASEAQRWASGAGAEAAAKVAALAGGEPVTRGSFADAGGPARVGDQKLDQAGRTAFAKAVKDFMDKGDADGQSARQDEVENASGAVPGGLPGGAEQQQPGASPSATGMGGSVLGEGRRPAGNAAPVVGSGTGQQTTPIVEAGASQDQGANQGAPTPDRQPGSTQPESNRPLRDLTPAEVEAVWRRTFNVPASQIAPGKSDMVAQIEQASSGESGIMPVGETSAAPGEDQTTGVTGGERPAGDAGSAEPPDVARRTLKQLEATTFDTAPPDAEVSDGVGKQRGTSYKSWKTTAYDDDNAEHTYRVRVSSKGNVKIEDLGKTRDQHRRDEQASYDAMDDTTKQAIEALGFSDLNPTQKRIIGDAMTGNNRWLSLKAVITGKGAEAFRAAYPDVDTIEGVAKSLKDYRDNFTPKKDGTAGVLPTAEQAGETIRKAIIEPLRSDPKLTEVIRGSDETGGKATLRKRISDAITNDLSAQLSANQSGPSMRAHRVINQEHDKWVNHWADYLYDMIQDDAEKAGKKPGLLKRPEADKPTPAKGILKRPDDKTSSGATNEFVTGPDGKPWPKSQLSKNQIGWNTEGEALYEDENGVRSILANGIRRTEPVQIIPGRQGGYVDVGRRGDEYKTRDEMGATEAAPQSSTPVTLGVAMRKGDPVSFRAPSDGSIKNLTAGHEYDATVDQDAGKDQQYVVARLNGLTYNVPATSIFVRTKGTQSTAPAADTGSDDAIRAALKAKMAEKFGKKEPPKKASTLVKRKQFQPGEQQGLPGMEKEVADANEKERRVRAFRNDPLHDKLTKLVVAYDEELTPEATAFADAHLDFPAKMVQAIIDDAERSAASGRGIATFDHDNVLDALPKVDLPEGLDEARYQEFLIENLYEQAALDAGKAIKQFGPEENRFAIGDRATDEYSEETGTIDSFFFDADGDVHAFLLLDDGRTLDVGFNSLEKATPLPTRESILPTSKPESLTDKAKARKRRTSATTKEKLDKFKNLLKNKKITTGVDPELVEAAFELTVAAIDDQISTFAEFVAFLVDELGAPMVRKIHRYVEIAWDEAAEYADLDKATSVDEVLGDDTNEGLDDLVDAPGLSGGVRDGDAGGTAGDEATGDGAGRPDESGAGDGGTTTAGGDVDDGDTGGRASGSGGDATTEGATDNDAETGQGSAEGVQENFRITEDVELAPASDVAKAKANIEAIELLAEMGDRPATEAEKRILVRYSGWGGVANAFNRTFGELYLNELAGTTEAWQRYKLEASDYLNWKKKYGKFYRALTGDTPGEYTGLLTKEEWQDAADSTSYAHYTSRDVISAIWKAIDGFGFTEGSILEPAAGVGHFLGLMPESMKATKLIGVEMDRISGNILSKLYPEADIYVKGFQDVQVSPNSLDVVVANPPFSDEVLNDAKKRYGEGVALHNYFMRRIIESLKPGGVAAVISSHFTMDASVENRRWVAERADLVGAIRLPNNAFLKNAGTKVTTDILFLRKKTPGFSEGQAWQNLSTVGEYTWQAPNDKKETQHPIRANEYFAARPEMVLGQHSMEGKMRGGQPEYTVLPTEGDLADQLAAAVDRLPVGIFGAQAGFDEDSVGVKSDVKDNTLQIVDGEPVVMIDGQPRPIGELHKNLANAKDKVKRYIGLRDYYDSHIELQRRDDATDEEIAASIKELNRLYERFAKKLGKSAAISGASGRPFRDEPSYYKLLGLEREIVEYDANGKKTKRYVKSDVLKKRSQYPVKPPSSAESLPDAVRIAHSYFRHVDPEYVAGLLNRSQGDVEKEMEQKGLAYQNPSTGMWEIGPMYLSGDVLSKLAAAKAAAGDDKRYQKHVDALEKALPERRDAKGITFTLSSTWLPESLLQQFARDALESPRTVVRYNDAVDRYVVLDMYGASDAKQAQFGTQDVDYNDIFEKLLNQSPIRVMERESRNSPPRLNPDKTKIAKAAGARMEAEFNRWVRSDSERLASVVGEYNDALNFFVKPDYSITEDDFQLPGANPSIVFRPYQRKVVNRLMAEGRGMVAHGVGAGKTYVAAAVAMESRRIGTARKPMIVAHNITLSQYAQAFSELYPNANVLVATKRDLEASNRKKFMARIAANDYDAIVVAQSSFDLMGVSPEMERAWIDEELTKLEDALSELQAEGEGEKSPTVKEIRKQIRQYREKLHALSDRLAASGDEMSFEDLGVDLLIVDEAHNYKKPPFTTKLGIEVKGIDTNTSGRGMQMLLKTRAVQTRPGNNGYRGVVLMTGTPITNTMAEVWHMMRMAAPDVVRSFKVDTFDRFVSTFGSIEPVLEMNAGQEWDYKQYLSKFRNGYELSKFIDAGFDVFTSRQLQEYFEANGSPLPKVRDGGVRQVIVPESPRVAKFNKFLRDVFRAYKNADGETKKENTHVPLGIYNIARAAALDIRLVFGEAAEEDAGSKANVLVQHAMRIYEDTHDTKGVQLIFSDLQNTYNIAGLLAFASEQGVDMEGIEVQSLLSSQEQTPNFLYRDIKRKLVERGVPESEIAIISDVKQSEAKRKILFEKVNSGAVRFVLGGTSTLGTGANVQTRAAALHHLDTPYRPSDMEQREGRIVRWGNIYATEKFFREVELLAYGMQNTPDAALFGKLLRKAKMAEQALSGKLGQEFEDPFSEVTLTYEEIMAELSGDKRALELIKLQEELRNKETERASIMDQRSAVASDLQKHQFTVRNNAEYLKTLTRNKKLFDPLTEIDGAGLQVTQTYPSDVSKAESGKDFAKKWDESRKRAYAAINDAISNDRLKPLDMYWNAPNLGPSSEPYIAARVKLSDEIQVVTFHSLLFDTERDSSGKKQLVTKETSKTGIYVDGKLIDSVNVLTAESVLKRVHQMATELQEKIDANKAGTERAKKQIAALESMTLPEWSNEDQRKLIELRDRIESLKANMSGTSAEGRKPEGIVKRRGEPGRVPQKPKKRTTTSDDGPLQTGDEMGPDAVRDEMGFAPGVRERRLLSAAPGTKEISAADIIATWERDFGVPIRAGKVSTAKAAGIYKWLWEVVRLRNQYALNLAVASHEVAHHVDKQTGTSKAVPDHVRGELLSLDYEPGRANKTVAAREGWAEFVRMWITGEDTATAAPVVHDWFVNVWMAANPEWAAKFVKAQGHAKRWSEQGAFARARQSIGVRAARPVDVTAGDVRDMLTTSGERIMRGWIDQNRPLQTLGEIYEQRGGKFKLETPYHLKMAFDYTSKAHAERSLLQGVHTVGQDHKVIAPALVDAIKDLKSNEEYDEAQAYAVARFVLELAQTKPEYNPGMSVEDALYIKNRLDGGKNKVKYTKFADTLTAYNNGLIEMLRDAGAITSDEADKILSGYQHYVPLHRVVRGGKQGSFAGAALANLGPALKRRTKHGTDLPIVDIVEATIRRSVTLYNRALKAQIVDSLIRTVDPSLNGQIPMGDLAERLPPDMVPSTFQLKDTLDTLVGEDLLTEEEAEEIVVIGMLRENANGTSARMPSRERMEKVGAAYGLSIDDYGDLAEFVSDLLDKTEHVADAMATIMTWRPAWNPRPDKFIVRFVHRGKPVLYQLDPLLYETVMSLDRAEMKTWTELARSMNHWFKVGATGISTGFAGQNIARDWWNTQFHSTNQGIESTYQPFFWLGRYLAAEYLSSDEKANEFVKLFKEFGGELTTRLGYDAKSQQQTIRQLRGVFELKHVPGRAVKNVEHLIAASDVGPRLAEFAAVMNAHGYKLHNGKIVNKHGKHARPPRHVIVKAINAAGEATTNFKRVGTIGRQFDAFIPFFNATIQSRYRQAGAVGALRRPGSKQAIRTMLAGMAAVASAAAFWAWVRDDDDDERADWLRSNYWVLSYNGQPIMRVAKERDYRFLFNLTEAMLDEFVAKKKGKANKQLREELRYATELPGGGVVREVADQWRNWDDFTNSPIEPAYQSRYYPWRRGMDDPYVGILAKLIGQYTGYAGFSAYRVEHLLNATTGGAYRRWSRAGTRLMEGKATAKDLPVIRGFLMDRDYHQSIGDFYEARDKLAMRKDTELYEGELSKDTIRDWEKLTTYEALMTELRAAEKGGNRHAERTHENEKYIIGLARDYLGKDPLPNYPHPMDDPHSPPAVEAIVVEYLGKAWDRSAGKGAPQSGQNLMRRKEQWDAQKQVDAEMIVRRRAALLKRS